MTIPMEFQHASENFEAFLRYAGELAGLSTRNQTDTMAQAALLAFRRRLSAPDAIRFANVLPPVLRALFVTDWDPEQPPVPFADREALTHEVQALRRDHNLSRPTAIGDVASALRRHVDVRTFDATLVQLPHGAAEFWRTA